MGEDMQVLMARFDEKLDALSGRVHALEKDRSDNIEMQKTMATITANIASLTAKIDALNAKVDELEKKPGKRWDALITAIIGAIAGVVVGMLMAGA